MTTVALIKQCEKIIDHAYREGPETFETIARCIEKYVRELPVPELYASTSEITALEEKIRAYEFQYTLQKLRHDHSQGKDILEDFKGFLNPGHSNYPTYGMFLTTAMAKQLLKLGEDTGIFGKAVVNMSLVGEELAYSREDFFELLKIHGIDLENSPFLNFIQGIVQAVFKSSPPKTTYGCSPDIYQQTQAVNNVAFWTQHRIQTQMLKY